MMGARRRDNNVDQALGAQDDKSHATLLLRINGIAEGERKGVQRNLMVMEMDMLEVVCCLGHRTLYFNSRYASDGSDSETG
jgi:hypothetical protein